MAWADIEDLPADPLVTAHIQLLNAARARAEAQVYLERGNFLGSQQAMRRVRTDMDAWRKNASINNLSVEDAEYIEYQFSVDTSELDELDSLLNEAAEAPPSAAKKTSESMLRKRMLSQRMRKQRGS